MKVVRRLVGDALTIGVIFVGALVSFLGTLLVLAWIVSTAFGLDAIGPAD